MAEWLSRVGLGTDLLPMIGFDVIFFSGGMIRTLK